MAVPLTGEVQTLPAIENMTPRQIVAELDKFVVGQHQAKRAVAIALRNRWRRQQLPPELAEDIAPKNILMIGSTGVGKTEIARRLARLAKAPFLKVEASKFTEVGYVGRDVESMIRDLVEIAVTMVKEEKRDAVREAAYPSLEMFTPQGVEEVGINIKEMLPGRFGRKKKQQVSVAEAREILMQQ